MILNQTGVPTVDERLVAPAMAMAPRTVQVNDIDAGTAPAGGVTVTEYWPRVVGLPVISPEALIDTPGGRPVAV